MDYNKLEKLREKEKSKKLFAQKIGMSEHGVMRMIRERTLTVETLERIALIYNVPIESFFKTDDHIVNDDKPRYGKDDCRDCDKMRGKLDLAMQMMREKDEEIAKLNRAIGKKNNHVA